MRFKLVQAQQVYPKEAFNKAFDKEDIMRRLNASGVRLAG